MESIKIDCVEEALAKSICGYCTSKDAIFKRPQHFKSDCQFIECWRQMYLGNGNFDNDYYASSCNYCLKDETFCKVQPPQNTHRTINLKCFKCNFIAQQLKIPQIQSSNFS